MMVFERLLELIPGVGVLYLRQLRFLRSRVGTRMVAQETQGVILVRARGVILVRAHGALRPV